MSNFTSKARFVKSFKKDEGVAGRKDWEGCHWYAVQLREVFGMRVAEAIANGWVSPRAARWSCPIDPCQTVKIPQGC